MLAYVFTRNVDLRRCENKGESTASHDDGVEDAANQSEREMHGCLDLLLLKAGKDQLVGFGLSPTPSLDTHGCWSGGERQVKSLE